MTQLHTPTPWDINAFNMTSIIKVKPGPDSKGNTYIDGRHSVKIANVMGEDDMTWGERHANAEFIVRACNAHDDLVNALNEIEAMCGNDSLDTSTRLANVLAIALVYKAKAVQ